MVDFTELKTNFSFIDTPYDMLYLCQTKTSNESLKYDAKLCILSHVLGVLSVYIFPIIGGFGVVNNAVICYIFIFKYSKKSRQIILLTFLAASDFLFILSFGWLWLFPAKGLPYASGGSIYLFIININDMACRVYRSFYMTCSTWVFGAFLLVCLDRMLAIYFPLKMIKMGFRTALISSVSMIFICIIANNIYTGFIRWRKIASKIYCTLSLDDNSNLLEFMNLWRMLFVYSGVVPMVLIVFINISLIWKMISNNHQMKKLSKTSSKNEKKEVKATIIVLILSICFLIGSVPNVGLYFIANSIENIETDDRQIKDQLQLVYNLGDVGTHLFLWMESINFIIYYIKMKRFRVEINKLIGRKLQSNSSYCVSNPT